MTAEQAIYQHPIRFDLHVECGVLVHSNRLVGEHVLSGCNYTHNHRIGIIT